MVKIIPVIDIELMTTEWPWHQDLRRGCDVR